MICIFKFLNLSQFKIKKTYIKRGTKKYIFIFCTVDGIKREAKDKAVSVNLLLLYNGLTHVL